MAQRTRDDQARLPNGSRFEVPVPPPIPDITNSSHHHGKKPHLLKLDPQPNCNLRHMWPPSQAHRSNWNSNQSATNNSQHSRVTASRHPDNTDLRTTVTLCHLGELDGGGPQQPRTCQEFFHKCSICNCHDRDHTETPASCERGSYPSGNDIRGRVPLGVTVKRAVRPAQVASARVARRFLG